MVVRTDDEQQAAYGDEVVTEGRVLPTPGAAAGKEAKPGHLPVAKARLPGQFGWPIPSTITPDPDEARACIRLPAFDQRLLEKARLISEQFAFAAAECRSVRGTAAHKAPLGMPHFERIFRVASTLADIITAEEDPDYDALLILSAWHSVRPNVEGFLSSYPKALLCPLSHSAPPAALAALPPRELGIFERRAPAYLRYLLREKFGLRTCADIENADLRHLLRSTGFRLVRASAVAEVAFPGITQGDDPPVRPWKLTLRQELSDDRAAQLLIAAAMWQIKHGLRLVTIEQGVPYWDVGAFTQTAWEDAFLSLGVRVAPSLLRESGLIDWRAVMTRCIEQIGRGNLPLEVLKKVSTWPKRISHDDRQAIWSVLDQTAFAVMERVCASEPWLFSANELNYEAARYFRRWARLFDEVSPQILSRFGVSAFTALRRVAPQYFGWGCLQLKPWDLEQEHGKWKGPRGRALLRSAYAYALYENGLGNIYHQGEQVVWQCTLRQFTDWYASRTVKCHLTPYELLYGLASRHGLTPLLNREITHTEAVSLIVGMNVHEHLPKIEGCWELCVRTALEHHGGKLELQLVVPDLVPLPLRLRKAVLAPLSFGYLHKELRLVRELDLRMARETRRKLEELPGWWEDERIVGTPLESRLSDPADRARAVLSRLRPEPWLEPMRRIRFRALHLLISRQATAATTTHEAGLTSDEIRILLQLALEGTLEHTNIVQLALPAIRRGFEHLLARDDTRDVLDSLLLHVGTAYETEIWGQVRKFMVLDVINDLLALTLRSSLLHLMEPS